mmetsp:Transcript_24497/g.76216  ORF Transcript_24497/g.76216 Transcript_24497/m.76216 type:complete len:200 (-) Transcript_24497:52-651(-)
MSSRDSVILLWTVLYRPLLTSATSPIAHSGLASRPCTALKAGNASALQKPSRAVMALFSSPAARSCVMSAAKYEPSCVSTLRPLDCTGSRAASWKKSHIFSVVRDTESFSFSMTPSAVRVATNCSWRAAKAFVVLVTLPCSAASCRCRSSRHDFAVATSVVDVSSCFRVSSSLACLSVMRSSRSSRSYWASSMASSAAR